MPVVEAGNQLVFLAQAVVQFLLGGRGIAAHVVYFQLQDVQAVLQFILRNTQGIIGSPLEGEAVLEAGDMSVAYPLQGIARLLKLLLAGQEFLFTHTTRKGQSEDQ